MSEALILHLASPGLWAPSHHDLPGDHRWLIEGSDTRKNVLKDFKRVLIHVQPLSHVLFVTKLFAMQWLWIYSHFQKVCCSQCMSRVCCQPSKTCGGRPPQGCKLIAAAPALGLGALPKPVGLAFVGWAHGTSQTIPKPKLRNNLQRITDGSEMI